MSAILGWVRMEWRAILLILVAAAIQLFLVLKPIELLVVNILPDDAFYYFGIAKHIALGHGSTFDGINSANGYHPLWLLILIPVFSYFSNGGAGLIAPIHAALMLSIVINVATALLVARILAYFSENKSIQALGLFIWLFNPFLLYETINGLETSLSLFLFVLFVLLALRFEEGRGANHIIIGAVAGLMILARLDLAIYFGIFLIWLLVRQEKAAVRGILISGATAALIVAPWFIWNAINFHMLLTSASEANSIVNHQLIVQDHDDSWFQTAKAVVYNTQYELDALFTLTGMYAIACALFGAAVALAALRRLSFPCRLREITITQALFAGFLLLFFANAGIRWTVRSWYFVSFDLFLAILAVVVFGLIIEHIAWKRTSIGILVALLTFSFAVDWSKTMRKGYMPRQTAMYEAALWMNDNLPKGSVIGIFNAGIEGYFATHTVLDLDGLVNSAAFDAIKARNLLSYMDAAHVSYVAEFDIYLRYRYKSFFGGDPFLRLKLVHAVPIGDDANAGVKIYRFQ